MPFADLTRIAGELDIGIAPLADSEFNRSRSNVKLKEYAAGGAAWLASNVGLIEDSVPARVAGSWMATAGSRRSMSWSKAGLLDTVSRVAP